MSITIRRATPDDAEAIHALISAHVGENRLLPRSLPSIRKTIADWVVTRNGDRLVGCGALAAFGDGSVRFLPEDLPSSTLRSALRSVSPWAPRVTRNRWTSDAGAEGNSWPRLAAGADWAQATNNRAPIGHINANPRFTRRRVFADHVPLVINVVIESASSGLCKNTARNTPKPYGQARS